MKKLLTLIVILLVAAIFPVNINATQHPFEISSVEVEGVENPNLVNVERGDKLNVRVELLGLSQAKDVRVKAWIGGYEYDDVQARTSIFDVEAGVTYVKNLVLEIPNDIDASESYTLHVEAFNDDDSNEAEFEIQVEPQRHLLNFVDIIFNPGLSVKNTQPLFVTVRVENLGDKKEEDVRVEVSIPELGVSQRTFIDELVSVENSNDDDEETSSSSDTLLLDLSNVQPGTYTARVKVDYNRGHDSIMQTYELTVMSEKGVQPTQNLIVQATSASMNVNQGESVTYTFSIANLGDKARTFNFEALGYESWATASLDQIAATVLPGSTKEVRVNVNAKADADAGNKIFTVKVKEGNNVVRELQFDATVKGKATVDNLTSLRSGLEIGFIVLLVILVILGIILAVSKLKGKEEGGESYY